MFKKLFATTAIAMFAAMPAAAGSLQDPVVEPTPMPQYVEPASDWTGFYAGINGTGGVTGGTNAWGAGVHAGYLQDMGDLVIGGELSYNYVFNPAGNHFFGLDAIVGYDAGDVMPHVTFGGSYLSPADLFGVSAGAGLSVKATENIILTGRYRYTYEPTGPNTLHQGILAVSYRF
ncbi:outer membrane protein [Sinisalibacter lacisalsi]|uniref:Outer membrane protein beta-barrel domain-containing protein n=1 Tax=Sinisalibacter lacisalsi TaxID=1526570 RepID=A0ABQ1QLT4_9RHOB|nr:hypothetical protein [Sinisalibacter lacisalsi]GGD34473.1 hypothetical protein GCM10011358_18170 [Sinisalibacter lacisalsi]